MKPDYSGGSIVNLMSDIAEASGVKLPYPQLRSDHLSDLSESENIVLLIIDGMGHNYLQEEGASTYLRKSVLESMTSVFLPSTGSAITTFFTGVAPQQHAITGWFVHLAEYGLVTRYLPFTNVIDGNPIGTSIRNTIDVDPLLPRLNRKVFSIMGNDIKESVYSRFMTGRTKRLGYRDIKSFFKGLERAISTPGRTYTHAYWSELDSIGHSLGISSNQAREHLHELDGLLESFMKEHENATFIITADHGFSDSGNDGVIYMHDHPRLTETLTLPLCGDTRTAFCYVRPSQVSTFAEYVEKNLGTFCDMYESRTLIEEGWFGLYEANRRLHGRVGDYALVLKEGYAISNSFPGFEPHKMKGHHGGVSEDEMEVPLIRIDI